MDTAGTTAQRANRGCSRGCIFGWLASEPRERKHPRASLLTAERKPHSTARARSIEDSARLPTKASPAPHARVRKASQLIGRRLPFERHVTLRRSPQ